MGSVLPESLTVMLEILLASLSYLGLITYNCDVDSFLIDQLMVGDLRTIGGSDAVVGVALERPELIQDLMAALTSESPGLRLRSADVLEKISVDHAELLQHYKYHLIEIGQKSQQKEVQWHIGFILPRLILSECDADAVEALLISYLGSRTSKIVRVSAVEGLAQLAIAFPDRYDRCLDKIVKAMEHGAPSVVARGKRMIKLLAKSSSGV